ncbi:hypothetical protein OESDEN_07846 [Oesophagostomum dentatum]|uniref:MULE transposase domain-containing protein n=1 Tax=Oesophagostomum dentatum TaxID=61180 RepID=A0A0B1T4V8_OESDE|nr:hypothetical protein OESDEN_07846 [Oesophagostomum dentatum]
MSTRVAWQDFAGSIETSNESEQEKEDMLFYFHRGGFEDRQRTFRRAIRALEDPTCTMEHIPIYQRVLADGSRFLQFENPNLHLYYSVKTIEMAQQHGLYALVADGVHDLQPDATSKCGQLYTVHGVCNSTVDVPLLHAITTSKDQETYEIVFAQLKEEMEKAELPAHHQPSFPRSREAYDKCKEFLRYLHSTWYEGHFKDMWYKWNVMDTRTTNAAEAFHRLLGCLLQGKYPPMAKLLRRLRSCNTTAKGRFLNMERRRTDGRRLKRRDRLRRERIQRSMERYSDVFGNTNTLLSTAILVNYCRRMSKFVTNKTN